MGTSTNISWTDHTFNPWWGCVNVSPGCDNCYAEAFAKRTGHPVWGKTAGRRFFGEKHWNEPRRWTGGRVFCASMADVFEPNDALTAERVRLWGLIYGTPHLTWQLLTKRPEQVMRLVPPAWTIRFPENVWIGTTVEDQQRADLRLPRLLDIPASVHFLSCEPLLGPLDLEKYLPYVEWVICGGESGPRFRALDLDNARSLRDQCAAAGVPFFFKQVGGRTPTAGGDLLDGVRHKEFPSFSAVAATGREVPDVQGHYETPSKLGRKMTTEKGSDD